MTHSNADYYAALASKAPGGTIERQIHRLFSEAMQRADVPAGQTPAIECFVMLVGGPTIVGSLSMTSDGLLRMMSPGTDQKGGPALVEQFFEYQTVAVIAFSRDIKPTSGVIVRTS